MVGSAPFDIRPHSYWSASTEMHKAIERTSLRRDWLSLASSAFSASKKSTLSRLSLFLFLNFAEATLFCLLLLVSLSSCSLASCFFDLGFGLALGFGWALALVGVRERPEAKMSETI